MFLIVFTTLMLSVTAVFAQVATLQTAQINHTQTALAQTMINWHSAAVSAVHASMPAASASWASTGCTLTKIESSNARNHNVAAAANANTTPTQCVGTTSLAPGNGYLVTGYSTNFGFTTAAYQDTTTGYHYVITYATADPATGYVTIANTTTGITTDTGYTLKDLNAQLMRAAPQNAIYGTVLTSGGKNFVAVPAIDGGGNYNVPSSIPAGALAIVTIES